MANRLMCELDHARARKASIRITVKSVRAGRPGHPMVRSISLCDEHAEQLRQMGIEVVQA